MDSKLCKFTEEHEWVWVENGIGTIGITDYAQNELGDIVYVQLPESGKKLAQMDVFGTIEAVKAVSDLFSPVSGSVLESNNELESQPELINKNAFGSGWIIKIEMSNPQELDELMNYDQYQAFIGK